MFLTAASPSWSSYTNQSQAPDLAFPTIQCLPRSLLPLAWGRGAPFPHCSPLGAVGTAHSNPPTVGSSTSHTARGRVWTKAGTTSLTVLQGAPGMRPGILLQGDAGLWPGCNRNQEAASSPFSHCPLRPASPAPSPAPLDESSSGSCKSPDVAGIIKRFPVTFSPKQHSFHD